MQPFKRKLLQCGHRYDSGHQVQASRFIFCHFVKGLTYSRRHIPLRLLQFWKLFCIPPNLRLLRLNIHMSPFCGCSLCPHYFFLFQNFLAGDSWLPLALCPFLPFFLSIPQIFSAFALARKKYTSFLVEIGLFPTFSIVCHDAPESEGFIIAGTATPKQRPSWNAQRAWHETFFLFLSS